MKDYLAYCALITIQKLGKPGIWLWVYNHIGRGFNDAHDYVRNELPVRLSNDGYINLTTNDQGKSVFELTEKGIHADAWQAYLKAEKNLYNIILVELLNNGSVLETIDILKIVGEEYTELDVDYSFKQIRNERHTSVGYDSNGYYPKLRLKNSEMLATYIENGGYKDLLDSLTSSEAVKDKIVTNNYNYLGDYAGGNVIKDNLNSQFSFDNERANPKMQNRVQPIDKIAKNSGNEMIKWILGIIAGLIVAFIAYKLGWS